jgi:hypothetical protein
VATPVEIIGSALETLTQYLGVIDSDHAYIHEGLAYTFNNLFTLADGASRACILRTPAASTNIYVHWRPIRIASSLTGLKIELNEDVTYTGGTDETDQVFNRNRTLDATQRPGTVLTDGTVTITDAGLPLIVTQIGAGGRRTAAGGEGGADEEILFKPDTDYMIRVTNLGTADDTDVSISLFWYEETFTEVE